MEVRGWNRDSSPSTVIVDISQCERLGKFLLSKAPGPKCDIDAELDRMDGMLMGQLFYQWNDDFGHVEMRGVNDSGDDPGVSMTMIQCKIFHAWLGNVIRKHSETLNG